MKTVGVLALQGAVRPHLEIFKSLGVEAKPVRSVDELRGVEGLVLPGGESTTMAKLLKRRGLFSPLKEYLASHPCWGICAGAILLSEVVIRSAEEQERQESLGVLPVEAVRNYYGCQLDSFKTEIRLEGFEEPFQVDFIRAPRLRALDERVTVLGEHEGNQTALRCGHILATAFHTELELDSRLHQYFLNQL